MPLLHPPGHAQADFGQAEVVIGGVPQRAHFLAVDLPHSDDAFVMAFPGETSEAFCAGHNAAFAYFGGVPTRIVYDNSKIAVARILGNGTRKKTRIFSELQSHYLFEERFARPAKGNDKGGCPLGRSKAWSAMPAATSSFPYHALRALKNSTFDFKSSVTGGGRGGCAVTSKVSASALSEISKRSCHFRLRLMMPAIKSPREPLLYPWCAIAATITRCPLFMAIVRFWSKPLWIKW